MEGGKEEEKGEEKGERERKKHFLQRLSILFRDFLMMRGHWNRCLGGDLGRKRG